MHQLHGRASFNSRDFSPGPIQREGHKEQYDERRCPSLFFTAPVHSGPAVATGLGAAAVLISQSSDHVWYVHAQEPTHARYRRVLARSRSYPGHLSLLFSSSVANQLELDSDRDGVPFPSDPGKPDLVLRLQSLFSGRPAESTTGVSSLGVSLPP